MKPKQSLIIWCLLTTGMIFFYIYQQNKHIQHTYKRQRIERAINEAEKEILLLEQELARQTTPEYITQAATALGLRKTNVQQLRAQIRDH